MSIRSALQMTEPVVATLNATNIEPRIKRDGDHYVINSTKWWSSGVSDLRCRIAILIGTEIDMTPRLCLSAAEVIDRVSNRSAQREISMIKVAAPLIAVKILEDAIQAHGGGGVSQGHELTHDWAMMRTLRLTDRPDEVHNRAIARSVFGRRAVTDAHSGCSGNLDASR